MAEKKSETGMTTTAPPPTGMVQVARIEGAAEKYPIIANGHEAVEIFKENLGGQAISTFDLTIIKVPSQGMTTWEVPTIQGAQAMKHIEGIVIGISRRRAYWKDSQPSANPPDCGSANMEIGTGDNGQGKGQHDCLTCPMAQFGSAIGPDGNPRKGQACRENKLLAVLMPGEPMPVIIKVPPSSLKDMLQFQTKLPVRFSGAVCRFGLIQDKSDEGVKYSKIVPEFVGALPPEQAKIVREFALAISGQLEKAADRAAATADVGEAA